jgi:LPS sulfotransferase NodH
MPQPNLAQGPLKGYAICATPRSGSNFLSQLLESTGRLGRPLEYFNGPARRELTWPDYPEAAEL